MDKYFQCTKPSSRGKSGCKKGVELISKLLQESVTQLNQGNGAKLQDIVCYFKKNYRLNLDDKELETTIKNGVEKEMFKNIICKTVDGLYKIADSVKPKEQPLSPQPCPAKPTKRKSRPSKSVEISSDESFECLPKSKRRRKAKEISEDEETSSDESCECPPKPDEEISEDEESSECSDSD